MFEQGACPHTQALLRCQTDNSEEETQKIWCYDCNIEITVPHEMEAEKAIKPRGLTGLQNIGNTCYMNSALQALSNTPQLSHYFLTRELPPGGPQGGGGDPRRPSSLSLTRAFHRLLIDLWSSKRLSYIAPTGVLYGIRNTHPMFRGFQQHDTQEFLRCLMDQLHEEMKVPELEPQLRPPSKSKRRFISVDVDSDNSEASSGEEYETCDSGVSERSSLSDDTNTKITLGSIRTASSTSDVHSQCGHLSSPGRSRKQISYRSIISDIFDGKLLSSVQCLTCSRISKRVETFQDLSLPIPNRDHLTMLHQGSVNTSPAKCAHLYSYEQGWLSWIWDWVCSWFLGPTVSLHDCLAAFFSADELKGDNMYSCEKCNKLRNGVKFSRILQCPEVLCIHLKRFRHELMFSSKIGSHITFPMEGLDLRPYLHAECTSEVTSYDLMSVICHHGAAGGGGHYTAYALNSVNGKWYEYDDHCVTPVSPEVVASSEAYVLFYKKDQSVSVRSRKRAKRLEEMCSSVSSGGAKFLVSKEWLSKFNSFSEPGPIDNRVLLCPHGHCAAPTNALPLSRPLWEFLHDKYGGGPECNTDDMSPCEQCAELTSELKALPSQIAAFQHQGSGGSRSVAYAVPLQWLSDWEAHLRDPSLYPPPGPIDTSSLSALASTDDYAELSPSQWELLVRTYGGGPPIPLLQTDSSDSE